MTDSSAPGTEPPAQLRSRGDVLGKAGTWLATWGLRIVAIGAGLWVFQWVFAKAWTILLPIVLAIIICSVLWPLTNALRIRLRFPPAAAAATTLLIAFGVLAAIITAISPSIVSQSQDLAHRASEGISKIETWAEGPPLRLRSEQFDSFGDTIRERLQSSADKIAEGVFTGVSTAGEALITLITTIILIFFFLKDGDKFLPWLARWIGAPADQHVPLVLSQMWGTLGGFVRTQAIVSAVDAIFIGIGLVILDVPLAAALAVITFLGGFIPMIGAFVAGFLAVLVALVAHDFQTALWVLLVVIAVQQLEAHILSPILQSRAMNLHPTIILLSIALGGTVFGMAGLFLAVPTVACLAVLFRYLDAQVRIRTLDQSSDPDAPAPDRLGDDSGGDDFGANHPPATTTPPSGPDLTKRSPGAPEPA